MLYQLFLILNHLLQFFDVISLVGKGPLGDDAPAVQLGIDVVDRHAEDLDAVFQGLLDGVRTMTANIVMEMGYAADLHREALIAMAVVLFVFILMINVTFSLLRRKDRA